MYEKVLLAHKRYVINSNRVAGLMNVMSDTCELKPKKFMTYSGVSADIMRARLKRMRMRYARVPKTQTLRYLCFVLFSNTSHSSIFRKLGATSPNKKTARRRSLSERMSCSIQRAILPPQPRPETFAKPEFHRRQTRWRG
jgi:hypothetical protein